MSSLRTKPPLFWLNIFFAMATAVLLRILVGDFLAGGESWKQGDWLINNEAIDVRRGMLGSVLIRLADAASVSPVTVTILLQGVLALGTIYLTWRTCVLQGVTAKLLVLIVSAGFFLTFWMNDPQGAYRKEIFVFLAFALLAFKAGRQARTDWAVIGSMLAFTVGIAAHEGLIFFLPPYLLALYLAAGRPSKPAHWIGIGIFLIAVLLLFAYNATRGSLASYEPVCAALIDRGLDKSICRGAIEALTHTLSAEMGRSLNRSAAEMFISLIVTYALSAGPIIYFLYDGTRRANIFIALSLLCGLCFAPLFPIALDWGRWIDFHISSVVYIILIARGRGFPVESAKRYPVALTAFLVLLPGFVGIVHVWALTGFGLFSRALIDAAGWLGT